ncbi:carboxylate-amine ligase [Pseudonocardia halophobica]|uniref:carboxylate-amine ligase n=1 Tax=Pseudonocardia halophobica TaxID=29401 RepID=UPI003D8ECD69
MAHPTEARSATGTARTEPRTVGVEEEFLLVDPVTGRARAVATSILRSAGPEADTLCAELQREQLETGTDPCRDLGHLADEIRRTRVAAQSAAEAIGVGVVPLATYPLDVEPTTSPNERYRRMVERFGLIGREQLTCGCHVHVGVADDEEAVAALDRVRPWLAPLLALSVNSPFWAGADTGYAGYRAQVWARWPSAGPYAPFGSAAGYRALADTMLGTGTLLDPAMLYFDARVSAHHPTVEIRVADVCREPDDAVLVAALARALVETAVREWRAGTDPDPVRTEVLRLASWRAARSGVAADLVDPLTWKPAPARTVLDRLVAHVRGALDDAGDLPLVADLLDAVLRRGTGAERQRAVFRSTGDLRAVVLDALPDGPPSAAAG